MIFRAHLPDMLTALDVHNYRPERFVVRRFGKRRNISLGSFENLPVLKLGRRRYDLIVCADVLQYVSGAALRRGVGRIAEVLGGVAFLEAYTIGDEMEGDLSGWHPRSKREYRAVFSEAGFVSCGLSCYLTRDMGELAVELELS